MEHYHTDDLIVFGELYENIPTQIINLRVQQVSAGS
jgi:hypothetical protein